jgi:hypothetical protein
MSKQPLNRRGWLAGTRFVVLLAIGLLWALPATARDRPVVLVGIVDPPQIDSETGLFVGDVERLHDVLDKLRNDPAALGLASSSATIQLAEEAIYRLDPTKPEAGRVRLALGTEIQGGNQYTDDRDEDGNPGADGIPDAIDVDATGNKIFASQQTIIDGRGLSGERAVIEAGLENAIRNLTVWGARDPVPGGTNRPGAEIRLLLTDQDDVGSLEVDGVICEKGRRGIHVIGDNGAQLSLTARRSIFRDHADPVDFAWGVQVSSGNVSGIKFSATLRNNRIYNNRVGVFLASVGSRDGELILNSYHNVIEENNLGIQSLIRDFNSPQGSLRNRTKIHSIKDMIWNNGPAAGGVLAVGYQRDANGIEIRDNETELQFLGTRFVKLTASGAFDGLQNRRTMINQVTRRTDLRIVGVLLAAPDLTGPTSGMSVSLLLRRAISSLMPTDYDTDLQPIFINDNAPDVVDITVIGSQQRYLRTNAGVNELDESLFSRGR